MPSTDAPLVTRQLSWLRDLGDRGNAPAVVTQDTTWSYADLARRVDDVADRLASPRRLVLLAGGNTLGSLVTYLGALAAGHVVLMAPAGNEGSVASLTTAYDPDVLVDSAGQVRVIRTESAHDLHPDLALLLSTSGSTGSPKLVRLSWDNLQANAESIADYLAIRPSDRAATTLPLHYCYGLSVVHSHLLRGASLLLTDLSVVDDCFWRQARTHGVTALAGVPYTFELLDRVGFADMDLPRLRYVTQAGGRMESAEVRRWAQTGRERGWDLFVMYGQTEATARMAYLPPDLALEHPRAIGVAIPGGDLTIEDGELVYTGRNVMLGYAEAPADLALGRTVQRLRTGDLARRTPEGLVEITGRRSRFVKVLGHRVDLDTLERGLRATGLDARCVGTDGQVTVAVTRGTVTTDDTDVLRGSAARLAGIPARAVTAHLVDEQPVLATGKPDYRALSELAEVPGGDETAYGPASVAELYAALLHRSDVTPDSTFVTLGGDSLSYVEVSLRLEERLGHLPTSWHTMPVAQLDALAAEGAAGARPKHRWWSLRTVETSVWLRAMSIVFIVGTHSNAFLLQGTAHALLMLAGFNLARFQLGEGPREARVRRLAGGTWRVVAPTLVVVWFSYAVLGLYEPRNLLLLNWALGEPALGPPWRFWFVEALVLALVITTVLMAVPWVDRFERRHPLGLPMALMGVGLLTLYDLVPLPVPHMQGSAVVVFWLFCIGWAAAKAGSLRGRLLVTAAAIGTISTFSGNPNRDFLTLGIVLLVLWVPTTRLPRVVIPLVQVLAASSLYIYVIHWQFLPLVWDWPWVALGVSLAVGVAYWWLWTHAASVAKTWLPAWIGRKSGVHNGREARGIPRNLAS